MKFAPFALALSLPLALTLSACQQEKAAPANPEAKPGLRVDNARLVLPAVSGNPAAAYFNLVNFGDKDVTLAAVSIEGAGKAEMHETTGTSMAPLRDYAVDSGESGVFAPGGRHVMAFDLASSLKAGGTTEMTLTFADGDKLSTRINVVAAGAEVSDDDEQSASHGDMD